MLAARKEHCIVPARPSPCVCPLLWSRYGTIALCIVPLLLDKIGISVPIDIRAITGRWTEREVAFIPNFLSAGVSPGVEERISCRLHLLVRRDIDRTIGIIITIGAGSCIAALHTTYVWHNRINTIRAKCTVIATKRREAALKPATDRLVLRGKYKENVRNVCCPDIHILCVNHLVLHITVLQCIRRIGRGIYP